MSSIPQIDMCLVQDVIRLFNEDQEILRELKEKKLIDDYIFYYEEGKTVWIKSVEKKLKRLTQR